MQGVPGGARLCPGAFAVGDAASGDHDIDRAGSQGLVHAQRVGMVHLAFEQIGQGGQADMRVRAHIHAIAGREGRRAHFIEEDERPDPAALGRRQDAGDGKSAQILAPPRQDEIKLGHGAPPLSFWRS